MTLAVPDELDASTGFSRPMGHVEAGPGVDKMYPETDAL